MKKHIAKILRRAAEERLPYADKETLQKKYKQFKKAWGGNVKNGKRKNHDKKQIQSATKIVD
jgi:hypothetical protein